MKMKVIQDAYNLNKLKLQVWFKDLKKLKHKSKDLSVRVAFTRKKESFK
jgi:hypothetical protein